MTKEARISSVSFSTYPKDTMNVSVHADGTYTTFALQDERLNAVMAIIWKMIEEKKQEFAQQILSIQTPLAITAQTSGKIIDSDEDIPF